MSFTEQRPTKGKPLQPIIWDLSTNTDSVWIGTFRKRSGGTLPRQRPETWSGSRERRLSKAMGARADLAYLYENGLGVPVDYIAAYFLYSAASAAGDRRSKERLESLRQVMLPEQLDAARAQVSAWRWQPRSVTEAPSETEQNKTSLEPQ
jgi:TPR repeat protein